MTSSTRSSRAPATWSFTSTASSPNAASSPPSTSNAAARAEEKLLDPETLAKVYTLRRMIDAMGGGNEAILPIIERLSRTRDNREFLETLTKR